MIPTAEHAVPLAEDRDDDLLTRSEASDYLALFGIRMKPATQARIWSSGGDGPPCRHIRHNPTNPEGSCGRGLSARPPTSDPRLRRPHEADAVADVSARPIRPATVANLLSDPSQNLAVKDVLLGWKKVDPVDAPRDATLLAAGLERRAEEVVSWAR